VALVYEGLRPVEEAWSGIPSGLGRGLSELGHEVVFARAAAPPIFERARRSAAARLPAALVVDPELSRLRSAFARRRFRRAGPVDAVVQLATGFLLPAHPRIATYEDMTVIQAVESDPAYGRMPRRAREAWISRQRACYSRARVCLALSAWASRSIERDYGVPGDKVQVVGAGRNIDPRPLARDWWPPRYLFAGLDWGRKNGEGVLRAFRRVRAQIPEARLSLVGAHPDLEEAGVRCHGRLSLHSPPERRALERLFEQATCFVMPSFSEPLGLVYSEAGAAGIPSIGTTAGGAPQAVGDAGVCVDPGDGEALLAAMLRFADPEVARDAGRRAAAKRGETTWRAVAARVGGALGLGEEDKPG
jgi:glycosyltransferase involved in cell wall biosynthesis